MKDLKTKEKFVELRAEGRSFDSIADELKMSKTTLIKWSQELDREISNAKFFAYQRLTEQYKITNQERINCLMRKLQEINKALDKKDYNELSVKELLNIQEKLENKLLNEISEMKFRTGEFENPFKGINEIAEKAEITIPFE